MKKYPKNKGQVAIEYALVMVLLATVASFIWLFYEGLTEKTFYGDELKSYGLEQTVSLPFP